MCKKINNGKYVILIGLYLYEYGTEIIILNKFFFREISVPYFRPHSLMMKTHGDLSRQKRTKKFMIFAIYHERN